MLNIQVGDMRKDRHGCLEKEEWDEEGGRCVGLG